MIFRSAQLLLPFSLSLKAPIFEYNAYVSELDPSQIGAKQLIYSTYLGGSASDMGNAVGVDSSGRIFVTGTATSSDFPVGNTCSRLQKLKGSSDAFVTILDPSMPATGQLIFSTLLGGSEGDQGSALGLEASGGLYVAGATFSGDFPLTHNAYQFSNRAFSAGGTNGFLTRLDPGSTICSTPFPSPSAMPTATKRPTPTATATVIPGTPTILSVPPVIVVGGGAIQIMGTGFTQGSVLNFFVSTAAGAVNKGPLTPSTRTPTKLVVFIPDTIPLGQGFASLQVVNTDAGFKKSNLGYALLEGFAGEFPTILSINGEGLAATSKDPNFATNNIDTVVVQGSVVKLGGTGFDTIDGVAVDLFCACPGGKVGPFFLNPGNPALASALLSFPLPATGMPNSPSTGPGSFVVTNAGVGKTYTKKSNAVSVPVGAPISVTSISQSGTDYHGPWNRLFGPDGDQLLQQPKRQSGEPGRA